jgi:hypothetical protein
MLSKQSQYASNLTGTPMGMALYEPIPYRDNRFYGRVGDVAYFDSNGAYQWICNIFHTEVILSSLHNSDGSI